MLWYKEVDPIVVSPFYDVGDISYFFKMYFRKIKNTCIYNKETSTGSVLTPKIVFINSFNFEQNQEENRITLKYAEYSEIFCEATAQMTNMWLIDYANDGFISFYGCQMVMIKGVMTKFEGVLVFRVQDRREFQNSSLNYTWEVLKNQTDITVDSLRNKTSNPDIRYLKEGCLSVRNQIKYCESFHIRNDYNVFLNKCVLILLLFLFAVILYIKFLHNKFIAYIMMQY